MAFTRALIRNNPKAAEAIFLALRAAQSDTGASDDEIDALAVVIDGEASKSTWPRGFFS